MKITFIILSAVISIASFGQQFSITFGEMPYVYIGMDNYVSCTIEGLSNKHVVLSSNNGVFEKQEGRYIYKPQHVGDSKIIISKKINGKLEKIGEYGVAVRRLPPGIATFGGFSEGLVSKGMVHAQMGIGCSHTWPPNVCLKYTVLGYTFTVFRGDSLLFYKKTDSNLLTEEITQFCTSLQSKDKLLIYGITYRDIYGELQKANAIELEIE